MKIAVSGLAGAGKDTVAGMIYDLSNHKFGITRYAGPLKHAAEAVFGPELDERDVKEVQRVWHGTPLADRGVEAAYKMCTDLLVADEFIDKAGELYFELIDGNFMLSPRQYQQLLGTDIVRKLKPGAFVERVMNLEGDWVIPDARFPNELRDVNLFVYKPDGEFLPHESEKMAQELQCYIQEHNPVLQFLHPVYGMIRVIHNVGTMDDLESDVKYFLNSL